MSRFRKLTVIPGFVVAVLVIGLTQAGWQWRGIKQPIDYNHKKHLELGLECENCHEGYSSGTRAGLPPSGVCAQCHEEAQTSSPEEAKLRGYLAKQAEIPWQVVHEVPSHVYFSHRMHVKIGKLKCQACHSNVHEQATAFTRPEADLSMEFCMDCHRKMGASLDCIACHI